MNRKFWHLLQPVMNSIKEWLTTGWTQAWIPTVLAMREMNDNLWDLSAKSKVNKHFEQVRHQMMPDIEF